MPTPRTLRGTHGECAARRYLEGRGYQVLDANYRCRWGEVEIVAERDDTVVFVEVRTRKHLNYGTPQESLSRGKTTRLTATAESYLQEHQLEKAHWRIDLIAILLGDDGAVTRLQHIESAVEVGYSTG